MINLWYMSLTVNLQGVTDSKCYLLKDRPNGAK